MRNKFLIVAIGRLVALGTWAGVGASAGAAQHSTARTTTVSHVEHKQTHKAVAHKAKSKAPAKAHRQATAATSGESAIESESAAESGSATESDSHQDPPGQNVNHECPPNCDTANGEQP